MTFLNNNVPLSWSKLKSVERFSITFPLAHMYNNQNIWNSYVSISCQKAAYIYFNVLNRARANVEMTQHYFVHENCEQRKNLKKPIINSRLKHFVLISSFQGSCITLSFKIFWLDRNRYTSYLSNNMIYKILYLI